MGNANIPQIYDQSRKRLCLLDKAINVGYSQAYNGLWTAHFTLPADDPKNKYCTPYNYVEIYDGKKRIELFRIVPSRLTRAANGYTTYDCEHVIATLIDNILFKFHEIGNIGVYTPQVIRYVLDRQVEKNWKLGKCDFSKQFLYKWENENLCSALFSIPKPFIEDYHWTYDTTSYPWTVNLLAAQKSVGCEIRYRKNMLSIEKDVDPTNLVTRIYPLGYGEGDNQLTIASINNKVPYITADTVSTYGLKEVIWVDRRFQDAESLKATAQSMLNELKTPYISYTVSTLDLFKKTGQSFDEYKEGKVVRVIDKEDGIDFNAKVVEITKNDVTKADISIVIANKKKNVAGSIADLQERARINDTYSQGTATLLTIPYNDNADVGFPATFEFFLPSSMVNINKALLRIQLQPFRGYSKAIKGGGSITTSTKSGGSSNQTSSNGGGSNQTSSSGGGSNQTSSSGGGSNQTSSNGGGSNQTSSSGGGSSTSTSNGGATITSTASGGASTATASGDPDAQWGDRTTSGASAGTAHTHTVQVVTLHSHNVVIPAHTHGITLNAHTHDVSIQSHTHSVSIPAHTHSVQIPAHTHSVSIPAHTHSVSIPGHTHSVDIPTHTHDIALPEHTHDIQFGIYQGTTSSAISIKVDNKAVPTSTNLNNIDVIKYLSTDSGGRITRDTWHKIEIIPDKLTRVSAYLFLDIFTNSRGGGDY